MAQKASSKTKVFMFVMALVLNLGMSKAMAIDWSWTGVGSFAYNAHISGKEVAEEAGLKKHDIELEHLHLKIEAGLSDTISFIVGPCIAHHETLSLRYAYLEAPIWEKDMETILSIEAGRFLVPFGRFNYLSEATNYPTISRPMMFASHDQDIIIPHGYPHPIFMTEYSELGLNVLGNKWLGEMHQFWYAAWVGNGMFNDGYEGHVHGGHDDSMASMTSLTDIAWLQEKRFAQDNNGEKAVGGRLAYSFGELLTVGGSYMGGSYDSNELLDYSAIGADLSFKIGSLKIDSEYVTSPTQFSAWDSTTTKNVLIDEYTTNGFYVQAVYPIAEKWELVGMYDVLEREMAELAEADFSGSEVKLIQTGVHKETNTITKMSFGINFSPIGTLKIKTEYAFFAFKAGEHGHAEPDNVHRISTAFVVSF